MRILDRFDRLNYAVIVYILATLFNISQTNEEHPNHDNTNTSSENASNKRISLGPCQLCREMVKSFDKIFLQVERLVDSEDKYNSSLDKSIAKLAKIRGKICEDSPQIKDQIKGLANRQFSRRDIYIFNHTSNLLHKLQCLELFILYKDVIERWFNDQILRKSSLLEYLCIDQAKRCCPDGHFGPKCKPCPSYQGQICSGHGSCVGNGTRKGSGKCKCHESHAGELCRKCSNNHFSISEYEGVHECKKCDKSCQGCTSGGPKGCKLCNPGWSWESDYGCLDIDECNDLPKNPCPKNTFCINNIGSYTCFECDKACDGCTSDGPDNCVKCAEDYVLKNGVCIATRNEQNQPLENSRYATYFGLCLATCIIFRKNIFIASGIGVLVAVYIGAAEYTIWGLKNTPNLVPSGPIRVQD